MRLKSEIWIQAYLRRCRANDVPAFVVRRGQSDGGAIFIKVSTLDGRVDLYGPAPAGLDSGGGRFWSACSVEGAMSEQYADAYLQRQAGFDPDIWIVELEDRAGRHFLGAALVET